MPRKPNPGPERASPTLHIGVLKFAQQFSDAASAIVVSGKAPSTRISTTFLYGHAIELALKSILVKNGASDESLRGLGHNLERCLEKASDFPEGDYIDDSIRAIVAMLNPVYWNKHLEYYTRAMYVELPREIYMHEAVNDLVSRLDSSYRASLRSAR